MILTKIVKDAQEGLMPDILAYWYSIIVARTKALLPLELRDKISVEQDEYLPMKFRLNVSRRAVPILLSVIDESMKEMPYSTRMYFETVYNLIVKEYNNNITSTMIKR